MGGTPTYDLHHLQRLIGQGELSRNITNAATVGAMLLGVDHDGMVEAVLQLTADDLYKTMESDVSPGLWQDVYHLTFRGTPVYIKLQLGWDGRATVIQFKQR